MSTAPTPSDVVAQRLQVLRKRQGLTAKDLAERCRAEGAPSLTASVIANIESGRRDADGERRRHVTLEEWLILARVLHVAPIHLLVPTDSETAYMKLTPEPPEKHPGLQVTPAGIVREWIRGDHQLPGTDERLYFSEVPADEWKSQGRQERENRKANEIVTALFDRLGVDLGGDQGAAESEGGEGKPRG
ncbi:helix-turn-helix domain-containing protein [Streptomyces antibioticus]|uniref:helix-turn-helix domain-containing protein n=1 Tax=Streptomyces antibioticus TaxID=1890 RepID=UPI0033D87785